MRFGVRSDRDNWNDVGIPRIQNPPAKNKTNRGCIFGSGVTSGRPVKFPASVGFRGHRSTMFSGRQGARQCSRGEALRIGRFDAVTWATLEPNNPAATLCYVRFNIATTVPDFGCKAAVMAVDGTNVSASTSLTTALSQGLDRLRDRIACDPDLGKAQW